MNEQRSPWFLLRFRKEAKVAGALVTLRETFKAHGVLYYQVPEKLRTQDAANDVE